MSVTVKAAWITSGALILAAIITGYIALFSPSEPTQHSEKECSPNMSGVTVGKDFNINCDKK